MTEYSDDQAAEQDIRDEGIPWMAQDELEAYEAAETVDQIAAVHASIERRRSKLSEMDRARIQHLEYDHEAIQALFDRAGLPLE